MTTRQSVQLVQAIMDHCWTTLRRRLDGLTEDEFWWEPVPHCWTVRALADGRWAADYAIPDPQPPSSPRRPGCCDWSRMLC